MNKFLVNLFHNQISNQTVHQIQIRNALQATRQQIEAGLARPTAGTGTPIAELKGMARTLAIKANVGGGSVSNGGKGVRGCDELFDRYSQLVGMEKGNSFQKRLNQSNRG